MNNTYKNEHKKYHRIFKLLIKELKKTKIKDIDFIFGGAKTCINKINNRYQLIFDPIQLLDFYKWNTFLDYKGRYKPRENSIRDFFIITLYHELGHKVLGHCDYENDIEKDPAFKRLVKRAGNKAIYLYSEIQQKQADIYALNKFKELDRGKNICYTLV
jgi:hypothetical protein